MAKGKGLRWSSETFRDKGLIQVAGGDFVPADRVTYGAKKKVIGGADLASINKLRWQREQREMIGTSELAKKPEGNKRVKNATKIEQNGVHFDSMLELYMYNLLTGAGIHFEFQKVFELQRKFEYRGETVRAIKKVCDFYLPTRGIIIDSKGYETDISELKHKMLKSVLKHLYDMEPEIIMPRTKKECDLLLNKLLYDK